MKRHIQNILRIVDLELAFWLGALVFLACINPDSPHLPSFCVWKLLGFAHCPGCGLGSSVSFLLHGQVMKSVHAHPLGVFALAVILHRVSVILRRSYRHPLTIH